jgi:uncharacterized oxidoreductase
MVTAKIREIELAYNTFIKSVSWKAGERMKLSENTILITGGGSGIGLAFAKRFIKAGSTVIICGGREAKEKWPNLITHICDVTIESVRIALFVWVTRTYPDINVLVRNSATL